MEKTLIKIGTITDLNLRTRAKHYGAYVITNYETKENEVYAWSDVAEYISMKMFNQINIIEKGGKYYYVAKEREIEITAYEFNQLKNLI